jgi:tetratricopeptide (TPR) repeat protein
VRTAPTLPPETLIEDTTVTPSGEISIEPLEIETSSLAESELDIAALTPNEPVADLLRADDAVLPTEVLAGLEPTTFESAPATDETELVSGLESAPEPSTEIEEPVSLLANQLITDTPIEPLGELESSVLHGAIEISPEAEPLQSIESRDAPPPETEGEADDDLLVLDSVDPEGTALSLVEEEIEIQPEPGAEAAFDEVLDDGTDWDIPEELEAPVVPAPLEGSAEASLSFLQVEDPAQPTIEELEDRILDDPENPETHRALGEALLASGETTRGVDELDLALLGYENREDWEHALDLINELIRIDPGSVRYYQKRVEVAYRTGEKVRLIDSYLELGDALVRSGALEKALAVYRRVIEHEPENGRATTALMSLAPLDEPVPLPEAPSAPARVSQPAVPRAAAPAPSGNGDFIDLGTLILDDAEIVRDTRMRMEDEEPTGDEERDFKQMLSAFKRGIEQNIEAEDYESHYDLGIAFKEMGLLDEAIAEFQKALRSPQGRLRTSEALGLCFYEKAQYPVAEAILRRAIESQPGADDEKVGLLYWLARSLEIQSKVDDALATYRRVLAVDIRFADVSERMSQINAGRVG